MNPLQNKRETNLTSFLRGNRSGHHNTKLKTRKHVIEQNEQEKPN
jgi:hypothetical protein